MGVFNISTKLRYPLNPSCLCYFCVFSPHSRKALLPSSTLVPIPSIPGSSPSCSSNYSSGYPVFLQIISSIASKSSLLSTFSYGSNSYSESSRVYFPSNPCILRYHSKFQLYSTSAKKTVKHLENPKFGLSYEEVNTIIDIIKGNGSDMESRLDLIGSKISRCSVIEILRALNLAKVPALRFFEWIRDKHQIHSRNSDICSLVIDNFGQLGDYATMLCLLKDFRDRKICLNEKAFSFLPISTTTKNEAKESIKTIVDVLNEADGSCRNSGIHSLIEMLCSMNSFDLANFVIEMTEKKMSYYNVLVKHKCVFGLFEDARGILEEMRQIKCEPDSIAYCYLISSLCKKNRLDEAISVLEELLDRDCPPQMSTFEFLIYFACIYGRSDQAFKVYNQMVSSGIKPRVRTHKSFIRGYFKANNFEEAYRYMVDTAQKHKGSAGDFYNLLAGLHLKDGDILVAHKLLVQMIDKGLKPTYSVYRRVSMRLSETGKEQFAQDLKTKYSSLTP